MTNDSAAKFGALMSGAVEMSNVDLASEFTSMITAQRGFQANSRVISTADDVLQELYHDNALRLLARVGASFEGWG